MAAGLGGEGSRRSGHRVGPQWLRGRGGLSVGFLWDLERFRCDGCWFSWSELPGRVCLFVAPWVGAGNHQPEGFAVPMAWLTVISMTTRFGLTRGVLYRSA